ncbi:MAG: PucR family transcriptional regulator [Mycobacterium sp.]
MPSSDLEAQIAEIQTALLKGCDALGAIVADTIWNEVDYYGGTGQVGKDELTSDLRTSIRQMFEAVNSATPYSTEQPTNVGERRARAGIPLPAMLEAYAIAGRLTRQEVADLATARPDLSREAFMRIFDRLWLAQDTYTHAMAGAYRDTVSRKVLNQAAERAALAEALIDGRIVGQADLWEIAQILRLPAQGPYVAVAAECASVGRSALMGIEAKLDSLEITSAWRLLPDVQLGLVYVRDDAMLDLLKGTLASLAINRVGISSRFDDLRDTPRGIRYARTALTIEPPDGTLLTTFEATPLSIAAVSAPDVMKQVSSAVLAGFTDVDEREREVLFNTFRMWADAGGSIGDAAQRLHCHANTVRHRLRRVEELTGKSLGRPIELAELCLAFEVDLLLG